MRKHNECLICRSKRIIRLKDYYDCKGLVKCKECGFVFMEKIPTVDELNSHYKTYSYSIEQKVSPLTIVSYNVLLDEFEKYRKTNRLLDVGCGRGFFLKQAKERGWEVYGTEYSAEAVGLCESKGICMRKGGLSKDLFNKNNFDIITSFEVIEHINNPNDELKFVYNFLRKGGLFYCTTPNFNSILRYYLKSNYNIIEYPEHLSYYTKKTLNKVIIQNRFKNIKFLSTGISVARIKSSKSLSKEPNIAKDNPDERLRSNISKKWYLRIIKHVINLFLTFFNLGLSLKGYYVKI